MDWVAELLVFGALGVGACFAVLQHKAMRAEAHIARRERVEHPDPDRTRQGIRAMAIVLGLYGVVGLTFYVGWRRSGVNVGAIAAVAVAVVCVLVAAGFAIKSAWVPRK